LNRNSLISPHKIEFADEQTRTVDSDLLKSAVEKILTDHSIERSEISVALVDDPTIRVLNKQYLNHDYETDVISFVLEYDTESAFLVGQLIVSTDTAANLAAQVGVPMANEVLLYVIHGMLHLVGYDDKQPEDAVDMRAAEKKYLGEFGIEHRWLETSMEADSDSNEGFDGKGVTS